MSDSKSVVVGGGICGLFAALILSESMGEQVVLVEREPVFGGLLRCFDYGEFGRFDHGMHNMYETGVPEVDDLLMNLLDPSEWQILSGRERDLAGLYYRGRLQKNSPYIDLTDLPRSQWLECAAGLLERLNQGQADDTGSCELFARSRFGDSIAEIAAIPALEKLFGKPASALDVMATGIVPMHRVVLFAENAFLDLMKSEKIRERMGFPDQRHLPVSYESKRRGYYPRQYGMYRVVDALLGRLRKNGVELIPGASVAGVEIADRQVAGLRCQTQSGTRAFTNLRRLVWTAGLPSLAGALGVMPDKLEVDRPLKTVVVSMLIDRLPDMGDLYYFFCYEPGFSTLRVTNFSAYCVGAPRNGGYPISVELLVDADRVSAVSFEQQAEQELRSIGVLGGDTQVLFSRAESLASGFPMPTKRNVESLRMLRNRISELGLDNLSCLGILAKDNLFYQGDVLVHAYNTLLGR